MKIEYGSLTHAYVANRRFAELIVQIPWNGIPYDAMLKSVGQSFYAAYPSFAFQNSLPSDNEENRFLERLRRVFGGLKNIQKMNEIYCQHRGVFWALQIFFVLLLLYLVL